MSTDRALPGELDDQRASARASLGRVAAAGAHPRVAV